MPEQVTPGQAEQVNVPPSQESRSRVRHRCKIEPQQNGWGYFSELGWPTEIRDVSATGIGMLVRRRFEPGAVLFVHLTSTVDHSARLLAIIVAHVTETEDGHWILGCTFSRTLSNSELANLVLDAPRARVFAGD